MKGDITLDGEDIYAPRHRSGAAPRPRRHGVPEAEPVSQVDLRERRLRSAHPRPGQVEGRPRGDRGQEPDPGRPVRGGQGPPERVRHRPVRRPAAAAVHRPRHLGGPGGDPDGRALLGARPDRHRAHRDAHGRAEGELLHRHRHPLDAAGRARVATHRLLPSRQACRGG